MALWIFIAPGCGGSDDLTDADETAAPPAPVDAFVDAAAVPFEVRYGLLHVSDYSGCCDLDANCLGNNPATPYLAWALPPGPDEAPRDYPDAFEPWGPLPDPAMSRTFRLRSDEAVVLMGKMPPSAAYTGQRSYLGARFEGGALVPVLGSLGPSLNNRVIEADRGTSAIWDTPFIVVTSADAMVEQQVETLLVDAGFDPATIHYDRLPGPLLDMGLHDDADVFQITWRTAVIEDPSAEAVFYSNPEATVLRLTPREPLPTLTPHDVPELPGRGSGTTELDLQPAVDALGDAIRAANPTTTPIESTHHPVFQPTLECIIEPRCAGDIRDRLVMISPWFLLPDDDTYAMVYGVNHARAGKASYSNITVLEALHTIGLNSLNNVDMVGTARAWLPDHPQVDDLFATMVRRDCSGVDVPCQEVSIGCPGASVDTELRITSRAYLEPSTGAAPLETELVLDRTMFFPAPD